MSTNFVVDLCEPCAKTSREMVLAGSAEPARLCKDCLDRFWARVAQEEAAKPRFPIASTARTRTEGLRALCEAEGERNGACARCGALIATRDDHEPTALCDSCAHIIVQVDLPILLAEVERLRAEVGSLRTYDRGDLL